ncbi:Spo0B domain-containing protein [Clostridium aestuarii]|uniref:Spo0B domain-containing protein n=1 Tax=Clostridium aestuarii TaxID=338193 RepID=A0ABT4D2M3_9CLOT|nr:Spo0B domain-containing protein [Clostridium aestuarii]MCY6484283.1 Spo0B domain-containing protein [Clostridium aestuarii]
MKQFSEYISNLRKQRHDFMNDIQVIYGYLQLEREEQAKKYIEVMIKQNEQISSIYALGDEHFGFFIENVLKDLKNREIELDINIEINEFSKKVFASEYNKKIDLVNNIFNELENNKCKFIYIYIFEDELGQSLLIANNELAADELEWMEEWKKIDLNINDINLYKYIFNNEYAYRLTFV